MHNNLWYEGQAERSGHVFRWEAKVYPEGSVYGINEGRVSKLWVAELVSGEENRWQEVAGYDREWYRLPSSQEAMDFVDELLAQFE